MEMSRKMFLFSGAYGFMRGNEELRFHVFHMRWGHSVLQRTDQREVDGTLSQGGRGLLMKPTQQSPKMGEG